MVVRKQSSQREGRSHVQWLTFYIIFSFHKKWKLFKDLKQRPYLLFRNITLWVKWRMDWKWRIEPNRQETSLEATVQANEMIMKV